MNKQIVFPILGGPTNSVVANSTSRNVTKMTGSLKLVWLQESLS